MLDQDHLDVTRGVLDGQWLVVEHVRIQRQSRRDVGQQLLGQRRAQRHYHSTFDLLFEGERVDGPPDVVRGDVVENVDRPGNGVDLDFGGVRREGYALERLILSEDRPAQDWRTGELHDV